MTEKISSKSLYNVFIGGEMERIRESSMPKEIRDEIDTAYKRLGEMLDHGEPYEITKSAGYLGNLAAKLGQRKLADHARELMKLYIVENASKLMKEFDNCKSRFKK